MIYHCVFLLLLSEFINVESEPSIWFRSDIIIPDMDKTLIDKQTNVKCPEDERVDLSNLGLEEIPSGMVKSEAIKSITLDNNKIRMVKSDEFDGTPNLECLSISNNSIRLEELKLQHDGLKTFIFDYQSLSVEEMDNLILNNFSPRKEIEARFPNVEILSWKGTNYNFFGDFLTSFPKLTTIYLADSDLNYVDNSISMNVPNLKSIHLERNSIRHMSFENFAGVHELYLDANPIEIFDVSQKHNLTILSLSGCFSRDISFQINLRSLQSLDLSNNLFSQLMENTFDGVPYLKDLNLSHNRLEKFPDLSNLMSLRKLSLSYNDINAITYIYASPSLKTLNLRGNSITSIDETAFSKCVNLEELDLSENELRSLPQDWSIRMLSLRTVNLSSNKFKNIENMAVLPLTNLLELYVKDNYFPSINLKSLQYSIPKRCTVFV
ncbi:unnamed protein product [Xylocopa violacea]|uniref:Uncharacterized protein n=1 Tax=Xylocopa violacea TaxID=135666 RepID=A0ABP1PEZ0_XYLVO